MAICYFAVANYSHWTNSWSSLYGQNIMPIQLYCNSVLKYSSTGMTFCPYRLEQVLVQWPVDNSNCHKWQSVHLANLYPFSNLWQFGDFYMFGGRGGGIRLLLFFASHNTKISNVFSDAMCMIKFIVVNTYCTINMK